MTPVQKHCVDMGNKTVNKEKQIKDIEMKRLFLSGEPLEMTHFRALPLRN